MNQYDLECATGGAPRSPAWSRREGDDPQRPIELELAVGRRPVVVVASRALQRGIQFEQATIVVLDLIPAAELAGLD
jgi:hypothetical protein